MTSSTEFPSINPQREALQAGSVTRDMHTFLVKPNLPSFAIGKSKILVHDLKSLSVVGIVRALLLCTRRYSKGEKKSNKDNR